MLSMSKQKGITYIMVTHEQDLALCADRVITVLDGKVQSDVVRSEQQKREGYQTLFGRQLPGEE